MNIFLLSKNPVKAAQSLIDAHVRKMIVETTQLLSVAYSESRLAQPDVPRRQNGKPCKHFNPNNGCCRWVISSYANWKWLLQYANALASEYRYRFGKPHFCETLIKWFNENPPRLHNVGLTPPYQAMPKKYRERNFVAAYRKYYRHEKRTDKNGKDIYKWTLREKPQWA